VLLCYPLNGTIFHSLFTNEWTCVWYHSKRICTCKRKNAGRCWTPVSATLNKLFFCTSCVTYFKYHYGLAKQSSNQTIAKNDSKVLFDKKLCIKKHRWLLMAKTKLGQPFQVFLLSCRKNSLTDYDWFAPLESSLISFLWCFGNNWFL